MVVVVAIISDLFNVHRKWPTWCYAIFAAAQEIVQLLDCIAIEKLMVGMKPHAHSMLYPLPDLNREWRLK